MAVDDILVREVMRYTYPVLVATFVLLFIFESLLYRRLGRRPVRLARSVVWAAEILRYATLSITAGAEPLLSMDAVRPYIALLSCVLLAAVLATVTLKSIELIALAKRDEDGPR
jgi:hypothetical protein